MTGAATRSKYTVGRRLRAWLSTPPDSVLTAGQESRGFSRTPPSSPAALSAPEITSPSRTQLETELGNSTSSFGGGILRGIPSTVPRRYAPITGYGKQLNNPSPVGFFPLPASSFLVLYFCVLGSPPMETMCILAPAPERLSGGTQASATGTESGPFHWIPELDHFSAHAAAGQH